MVDVPELMKQLGCIVELAFNDGQVVRAKLQTINIEGSEMSYRVVELIAAGSAPLRSAAPGSAVVANVADLVEFKCLN